MVKEEEREGREEPSTSTLSPRKSSTPWEKQCTLCQKTFVSTSSANRHLRTIHGIDTSTGNSGYIIDKVSSEEEEFPSGNAPSLPLSTPPADIENTQKDQPRVIQSKICELCNKSFSTGSTLNRHLRNVHGVDTSKQAESSSPLPSGTLDGALSSLIQSALPHPLEITVDSKDDIVLFGEVEEEVEESFTRPSPSPLHLSLDDEAVSENASREYDDCLEIRCDLCGKTFSQPSTLNRHLREIHKLATIRKEQPMKPTACPVCGEILRSQSLALRHRKEVHGSSTKIARLGTRCSIPGCKWTGHTHRDLVTHAQSTHSSASNLFEWQSRSFETRELFERWIDQRRKEGVEWYSRSSKTIDGVKQEYRYCLLEISGRGRKDMDERQRIHCTSYIKLLMHDDNSVSAEYCLDHLGHDGKNRRSEEQQDVEEKATTKEGLLSGMDESEDNLEDDSLEVDDIPGPSVDDESSLVDASSLISGMTPIDSHLTISGFTSSRTRLCHNCGKDFSCGSTLYRHLREVHKEDHPKSETVAIRTPCAVCGEIFPSGSQMRVHRSTAHPGSLGHRMNCPLEGCQWNGSTHRDLIKHARSLHSSPSTPFLWETRDFAHQKEFNQWLEELKKTGVHFYIRRSEKRRSLKVENRCCYFEENRTRGVSSPSRQRNKFSRKSVRSCTCYLTLTIHEDGTISTGFCLDHLGHTIDLDERPFRDGRGGDEEEEEGEGEREQSFHQLEREENEEEQEDVDSKQDLEYVIASEITTELIGEEPLRPITVHDLHRFQESLARVSAGAARLRYSNEMDRLVGYLDKAFTATGLLEEDGSKEIRFKRRNEETTITNGKRVKREE